MPAIPLYSGNPFQIFNAPTAPGAVSGGALPAGPDVGIGGVPGFQNYLIGAQGGANAARIPNAPALETQSSADIAALLNPGSMFPDIDRQSAELGAARGVSGSPAALSTGVRMTDEERLRRIALGNQLLNAAYGRNPGAPIVDPTKFAITPAQRAELNRLNMPRGGGVPGGFGGARSGGGTVDLSGLLSGGFGHGNLFSPSGDAGGFDLDTALNELGLGEGEGAFDFGQDNANFDPNFGDLANYYE